MEETYLMPRRAPGRSTDGRLGSGHVTTAGGGGGCSSGRCRSSRGEGVGDGGGFNSFEKANEEDIGRQLLHFGFDEDATFRTPKFVSFGHDFVQTSATESVLARKHARGVVESLQAHGTLQHRVQHLHVHRGGEERVEFDK